MTDSVTLMTGFSPSSVDEVTEPVRTAAQNGITAVLTGPFGVLIHVVAIVIAAIVLRIVLHFVIRRVVNRVVSGVKKRQNVDDTQSLSSSPLAAMRIVQRTRTLGSVLNNVVTVVVVVVALLLVVTAIDASILGSFAIITAALGAGLGFGAQNIVKDVLNGLFMVAEDQLGVGDLVDLGPAVGVVEAVGIRITRIRSVDGTAWFVRNGEILRVGNMSMDWSRVLIDLAIPYSSDVDAVQDAMLGAAVEMSTSSTWRSRIIEKPEIWGIESISAEALVVRLVVKTRTSAKYDVGRELRLRLKRALDHLGVDLPPLNRVVFNGLTGAQVTMPHDTVVADPVLTDPESTGELPADDASAPASTTTVPGAKVTAPRSSTPSSTTPASGASATNENGDGITDGAGTKPTKRAPAKTRPVPRQDPRSTRIDRPVTPKEDTE